jgi:hypothetical protein
MRTLFLLICLGICTQIANAQTSSSPILMRGGNCFQDGKKISNSELDNLLKPYPEAYKQFTKYKRTEMWGLALMISIPLAACLVAVLNHDNSTYAIAAGIGVTSFIVGIPILCAAPSKKKKAVHLYNISIEEKQKQNISPGFGMTPNGIGFIIKF